MPSSDYWSRRFEDIQDRLMESGDGFYKKARRRCLQAAADIEKEINAFYGRFAHENGITYEAATRILNGSERMQFKMTLDEYIKKARTLNFSDRWAKELENASTVYRISRLKALHINNTQIAEEFYTFYNAGFEQQMIDTYLEGYYRSVFEMQSGLGVGRSFDIVDPQRIRILVNRPWAADGYTYSDRIWGSKRAIVDYMDKRIARALMTGEDKRRLIREMADQFSANFKTPEAAKSAAGRLICTEAAYVSALSAQEAYKSQGVEKFRYIATLDELTCEVCGPLDGKIFIFKDYQPGVNAEPMHPRCRCHTTPEISEEFADAWAEALGDTGTRTARDEKYQTYKVPKDTTWTQWKERYASGGLWGAAANS